MKYIFLVLSIFIFSNCSTPTLSMKDQIIYDACEFLWKKQNDDGGWRSETHGIMKSGQSVSAFVFYNLLQVPDSVFHISKNKKNKALDFFRHRIQDGVLGTADSIVLDYPNYATAYALRIFHHFNLPKDKAMMTLMRTQLLSQQFTEQRGFYPENLAYGGWGFGEKYLDNGKHGHIDLSHTRRILQSLQSTDSQPHSYQKSAQIFLSILQKNNEDRRLHPTGIPSENLKYDGGFYASPVTVSTNKGEVTDGQNSFYRSYATATADGLLALLASGVNKEDSRVKNALDWLVHHPKLEFPEGIPQDNFNQWHQVMFYYHLAVRAQAYRAVNYEDGWEDKIVSLLLKKQNKDGSFSNPMGAANKEDDPLIATSFVLQALVK